MNRLLTTTFYLLSALACHSQSWQFENLSIKEGMPSLEVYNIFQDKKGFIWFATDNGVVRFDGLEMKAYHVKEGLVDPVVFGFHEDDEGRIWFRSYSGKLAYYDKGQIIQYKYNHLISQLGEVDLVYSIYFDVQDEALWLTASGSIIRIAKDGTTKSIMEDSLSLYHRSIKGHGLYGISKHPAHIERVQFDEKLFPITISDPTHNPVIQSIRWHNRILLSVSTDIFLYDGKQVSKIFTGRSNIISLSIDDKNNLWVGYLNKGVDCFRNGNFKVAWAPESLAKMSITGVMQDSEGGFWFSTLEKGVYYAPQSYTQNLNLPPQTVRAVLGNRRWIITGDLKGNLLGFNTKTFEIDWKKNIEWPVTSIFEDHNKNLWVSSSNGQLLFDKNLKALNLFDTNPNLPTLRSKIDFTESNGTIWSIGGSCILKIENNKGKIVKGLQEKPRAIAKTNSHFYIAGRTGLQIYSNNFDQLESPQHLSNLKITDILNVNDSTLLLITTGSGFLLFNERNKSTRRYDSENNLMTNTVYCAIINKFTLWLGTEKGVIKTNVRDLVEGHPKFKYLTQKSGLASNKVNFIAPGYNSIWAFTENGVSIIPDSIENFSNANPTFYLKNTAVNQKSVDLTTQKELQYDQNNISISFGFISFNNNKSIRTRFHLSPTEPWVYAEQRDLQFYSLAPGSYSLTLQYSVDNNEWMTAIDQLSFTINPPWWRAWYYQITIFLILLTIVSLFFRGRVSVWRQKQKYYALIKDQQQKLLQSEIQTIERERGRIAKDLHDTVGTNMAAVKMIVSQLLRKHHEPLAENIEGQLQDIIKETKELIYNLVPPGLERFGLFVLVRNHISKLNHSTQTQIEITTSGNDVYRTDRNIIIFRIIQELISNSLKHANATTISIGINTFENHVNIMYEDNGHGFKNEGNQSGFGILNIQSRVESLAGEIRFESGHSGTFYTLNIPYPQNADSNP